MSKDPIIVWEKWYSPFGEDDEEQEELISEEDLGQLLEEESDYQSEAEERSLSISKQLSKQKFMITPIGIMPITDNTESTKIFNFWTGHTNFNISNNIASIIESCDGVETLDIFTRYRFRIAIGKIFKESDVMYSINEKVYEIL